MLISFTTRQAQLHSYILGHVFIFWKILRAHVSRTGTSPGRAATVSNTLVTGLTSGNSTEGVSQFCYLTLSVAHASFIPFRDLTWYMGSLNGKDEAPSYAEISEEYANKPPATIKFPKGGVRGGFCA